MAADFDLDPQDYSEVFDEDNQSLDGAGDDSADMKTLEELPDVLDVTSAVGDAADDAALIAEDLDDEEIIDLEQDGDFTDIEDDDLAGRMPEAFDDDSLEVEDSEEVVYAGEAGLDLRSAENLELDDRADPEAAAPPEDAELELTDDIDAPPGATGRVASRMESTGELSDEDLKELGYRDDKGPR